MDSKSAITWLNDIKNAFHGNCTTDTLVPISRCHVEALEYAINSIKELQQRREQVKKAHWVEIQDTPASVYYCCSNCNMENLPTTTYCPWCGAEMEDNKDD